MTELFRTVLWQELAQPGTHWCELAREETGWRISGVVLTIEPGVPLQARYEIALDEDWATRDVQVSVRSGDRDAERRLRATVEAEQRWRIEREPAADAGAPSDDPEAFRGIFDIDLSISPATNTLPIRRLNPAIGEAVDVTAVWIGFPDLSIELLPQRYIRLDERRYRYESNEGAFVAEIAVDDLGLVVSYEGLWQRIGEAGSGS